MVGDRNKIVLIRAIDASLSAAGVASALEDPELQLIDGRRAVVTGDNNSRESDQARRLPTPARHQQTTAKPH